MYRIVTSPVRTNSLKCPRTEEVFIGRGRSLRHNKRFRGSEGDLSELVHTREVTI